MATASKAFRARAFDANKSMAIYWGYEVPDLSECVAGNRAVTQMPSGMEKEEEMESHLQDAILAQQASTSGVQVNHVIPTPKVNVVEKDRYNTVYPSRNKHGRTKYIKVHAWHALEKDEPDYDCDTEDEEWLNDRPHIEAKTLEKIFDTVEANSSETQIASEESVLNTRKNIDPTTVYEVYEYWLSKRTSAATTSGCVGVGGLIPKIRNECRKDGQGGSVNPYVAFRRRAEKMQTRKNRKNDEDNYEKILKLVHDMSKAKQLFDMTVRREKTKLALIDMDSEILTKRMALSDFGAVTVFGELSEKAQSVTPPKPLSQINGVSQEEAKKKKKARKSKASEKDVVSKAWLKKNSEKWNRPPALFGQSSTQNTPESTKPAKDLYIDGKYSFKRRRGCTYRAALPCLPSHQEQATPAPRPAEQGPAHMRFYETFLPDPSGNIRSFGYARRRIGRGGRMVFDRVSRMNELHRSPKSSFDPWEAEYVIDSSRTFRARMNPLDDDEEESEDINSNLTDRHFARSEVTRFNDDELEMEWESRYEGSWREETTSRRPSKSDEKTRMKDEDSEVERMDVEEETEAQITDSRGDEEEEAPVNGNGKGCSSSPKNEDEDDVDMDDVVLNGVRHHSTGGKSVPMKPQNSSSQSGNGLAGRVEPTPVPAKMCGTVSDSDEWREPSGSPSESNSSTEWCGSGGVGGGSGFAPEQVAVAFKSKMMNEDEEPSPARAGDRDVASMPPSIKDAMSTVTMQRNSFILPSSMGM